MHAPCIPTSRRWSLLSFFFNATATPDLHPLSLHDALPICMHHELGREIGIGCVRPHADAVLRSLGDEPIRSIDRKSTRLNSSHRCISYAVFCLKKKNNRPNGDYALRTRVTTARVTDNTTRR